MGDYVRVLLKKEEVFRAIKKKYSTIQTLQRVCIYINRTEKEKKLKHNLKINFILSYFREKIALEKYLKFMTTGSSIYGL